MVNKQYILSFQIWENKKEPLNFKDILLQAPGELVKITMSLKDVAQNPKWHPRS